MNSEVWDLRTRRLVRAAPALEGATPVFGRPASDVIFASARRLTDDLGGSNEENELLNHHELSIARQTGKPVGSSGKVPRCVGGSLECLSVWQFASAAQQDCGHVLGKASVSFTPQVCNARTPACGCRSRAGYAAQGAAPTADCFPGH